MTFCGYSASLADTSSSLDMSVSPCKIGRTVRNVEILCIFTVVSRTAFVSGARPIRTAECISNYPSWRWQSTGYSVNDCPVVSLFRPAAFRISCRKTSFNTAVKLICGRRNSSLISHISNLRRLAEIYSVLCCPWDVIIMSISFGMCSGGGSLNWQERRALTTAWSILSFPERVVIR